LLQVQPPTFAIVVVAGLYALGSRWRVGSQVHRRRDRWRTIAFAAGLLTLVAALDTPIDTEADRLFAVHMVQHVLLLSVAPPLIVLGAPWARIWRPLPLGFRRAAARALVVDPRTRPLRRLAHGLGHPAVAWVAFCGNLVLWHVPALYDATLRNGGVHDLEHALFFTTGLLFWAQVIPSAPFRVRLDEPRRALYVTLAMLVGWVLAVVLGFARAPLYHPYAALAHRPGGLSALADQQIAAGVMWVPGSLAFTIAIVLFFYRWLAPESESRRRPARSPLTTTTPLSTTTR
jgi:cytochrome c oxidase assembly factor CtaG